MKSSSEIFYDALIEQVKAVPDNLSDGCTGALLKWSEDLQNLDKGVYRLKERFFLQLSFEKVKLKMQLKTKIFFIIL